MEKHGIKVKKSLTLEEEYEKLKEVSNEHIQLLILCSNNVSYNITINSNNNTM